MMKKQRILVVGTGGTISMEDVGRDELRYELRYSSREIIGIVDKVYALKERFEIDYVDLKPMDSDDLPAKVAWRHSITIYSVYDDHDAIIALRGTGNMAYSSADTALRFRTGCPIINIGSQKPHNSKTVFTDVYGNVANAFHLAEQDIGECCVLFGTKILRASRLQKRSSDDLQPFEVNNDSVIGEIGTSVRLYQQCRKRGEVATEFFDGFAKVKTLEINVSREPWEIDGYIGKCDGLILEGYEGNNVPKLGENNFIPAIEKAAKGGLIIMVSNKHYIHASTQRPYTGAHMARKAGAILLPPMSPDAALAKASIVLSKTKDAREIGLEMNRDYAGEIMDD